MLGELHEGQIHLQKSELSLGTGNYSPGEISVHHQCSLTQHRGVHRELEMPAEWGCQDMGPMNKAEHHFAAL